MPRGGLHKVGTVRVLHEALGVQQVHQGRVREAGSREALLLRAHGEASVFSLRTRGEVAWAMFLPLDEAVRRGGMSVQSQEVLRALLQSRGREEMQHAGMQPNGGLQGRVLQVPFELICSLKHCFLLLLVLWVMSRDRTMASNSVLKFSSVSNISISSTCTNSCDMEAVKEEEREGWGGRIKAPSDEKKVYATVTFTESGVEVKKETEEEMKKHYGSVENWVKDVKKKDP